MGDARDRATRLAGFMNDPAPHSSSDATVSNAPEPRERWWTRHRRIVGGVGALAAAALAATWLVVVPGEAAEASGVQRWVLEYAHSICWALLALAAAGFAVRAPRILIDGAAYAALASYAAFLLALAL